MSKRHENRLAQLEQNSIVLGRMVSEHQAELEKVKNMKPSPVPRVRRNLKEGRIISIKEFYLKRKLKSK